ncbi:MAG: hypothetical protein FJX76_07045 [Armatimonadetes bacterium]|nr:hypothetical protein [Armatimonadota bacterium]
MRCVRCKGSDGGVRLCADCRQQLRVGKRDPAEIGRLFEQAWACIRLGDIESSVKLFTRLLKKDARHLGAHESLILAEGARGAFGKAVRALRAMHGVTPVLAADPPGRVTVAEAAPTEEAAEADLVALGLFYRQLHQLDLAEAVLQQALDFEQHVADANLILGSVYREKGKLRKALRHLKATQGGHECAGVEYEMGLCHEGLGQLKKAHALVSKAVTLEPDNPHMHLSLGMLYEKLGRQRLARREYRVASSLNGAFAPALVDISFRLGLQSIEDGGLDRALTEFRAGVDENPSLFAPAIMAEIDHLLVHIIRAEQVRNFMEEHPGLGRQALVRRSLEDLFASAARLAFFTGLSFYWDGCYEGPSDSEEDEGETFEYEPAEPEATWLEGYGPSGRLLRGATPLSRRSEREPVEGLSEDAADELAQVRAEIIRPEAQLGFPPVPFEFIFEEWLNVHATLASPRIAERPLASPDAYQRLLALLSASMRKGQSLLKRADVKADEEDSEESVNLAMSLWATIIESFTLRNALDRCRAYPREFLVRFGVAERYRQRRFFGRAIRELESALSIMPENASLHNFLWNLHIRESNFAQAQEHCEAVLRFTPHHLFQAAAYNDLAYCMVELGSDLNRALVYTEKARELAPQLFDAHVNDTVAWLHWRQGNHEQALSLIENVIEAGRSKSNPLMATSIHFYHYGHILRAAGRDRESQEAFARALEMEADAESDWGVTRRLQADLGE